MMTRAFIALALGAAGMLLAKDGPRQVYILTGQSNSLGAVKGSPASPELLEQYRSDARLWNGNMNRDTGECFEKNPSWAPVAPQLPAYNGSLCMGPEYGFSSMMKRLDPDASVDIIKASLDGGGNHYWLPGGNAYNTVLRVVKAAMKEQKKSARISALLYLQGESDAGEEVALAQKRFTDLVKNLKKDLKKAGVNAKGLKFCVIGEPANWHGKDKEVNGKTTAEELYKLAESRPDIAWARTRDLAKITSGDSMGVHYDGKSQITIGSRFACALLAAQGSMPAGMRGDAVEPLDKPAAWWGGKAPDKNTMAVWNVASANAIERLQKPLSVKGMRIEDPFADTIVIQGGQEKSRLYVGESGIDLQGADLQLEGVSLHLAANARISGSRSANLSGGSLDLVIGKGELEPAGPGAYRTKKISAVESVSGKVSLILEEPASSRIDIFFQREDGSPVDFGNASFSADVKQGEPGHLMIGAKR